MLKNEGLEIFENDLRIYPENENIGFIQGKTNNAWHITLERMTNIYAIAIRGIGNGNQWSKNLDINHVFQFCLIQF
jgi:hypothetical protein